MPNLKASDSGASNSVSASGSASSGSASGDTHVNTNSSTNVNDTYRLLRNADVTCNNCSEARSSKPTMGRRGTQMAVIVVRFLLAGVTKFITFCTTAVLMIVLLYWLYGGFFALMLLVLTLLGFLYNLQDNLLYHPEQPRDSRHFVDSPAVFGLPHENVFVKTRDNVRLNLVFIKQAAPLLATAPTFIVLHGNAGNIGHRLPSILPLYSFVRVNILLVEYRGYGRSEGVPSEKGLYLDMEAAIDFALQRADIDRARLVVFGRSLGGAVAAHLAARPGHAARVSCVVLENTFTSLPAAACSVFDVRAMRYLPHCCYKNRFETRKQLRRLRLPTLFLSGLADTLVPPAMMLQLYDESGSMLKRLAQFKDGGHNDTWQCHGYYDALNWFLTEVQEATRIMASSNSAATYNTNIPFNDGGISII